MQKKSMIFIILKKLFSWIGVRQSMYALIVGMGVRVIIVGTLR